MRKGCEIIQTENFQMITCGGEPTDHECNEDATCFDTVNGKRIFFKDKSEADIWYKENYEIVSCCSVACSICERAAIDNAMWLNFD